MEPVPLIYFAGIVIFALGAAFWGGLDGQNLAAEEKWTGVALLSPFWPLMLPILCFFFPLWLAYKAGKAVRR